MKYLIMGSVAAAFLSFGVSLLYAATGSTGISETLGPALRASPPALAALALILIYGLGIAPAPLIDLVGMINGV